MATCKQCREFEKCKDDAFINGAKFDPNESVKYCTGFEPITNSDRIRAMSDEELAQAIYEMVQGSVEGLLEMFDLPARIDSVVRVEPYKKRLLSWLQQPAEEVQ